MQDLTAQLAIWGAVTGTIGAVAGIFNLYFRFIQHRKDRAHITAEAIFNHDIEFDKAVPKHHIIIRSHGKTPVTIDFLYLCVRPRGGLWKRLLKRKMWAEGKWIHTWKPRQLTTLSQGRRADVHIEQPQWAEWGEVLRAYLVDETGKKWKIKWPRPATLAKKVKFERLIETTEFNENKRKVKLAAFCYGENYRVHVNWTDPTKQGTTHGKYFHQTTRSDFDAKLKEVREVSIPQLLSLQIDDVK